MKSKLLIALFLSLFVFSHNLTFAQNNESFRLKATYPMAQKIKYAFDTNNNTRGFLYSMLKPKSLWDMQLLMEDMLTNTEIANDVICAVFDVYGTEDLGKLNLMNGFGFTVPEVKLSLKIYEQHQQVAAQAKAEKDRREAEERALKIKKATENERELLNKWQTEGFTEKINTKDKRLEPAKLDVIMNNITDKYDKDDNLYLDFDNPEQTDIFISIDENGSMTDISGFGPLINLFDQEDFVVKSPATFHFNYIDTVVSVPSSYNLKAEENLGFIGDLKANVKYNQKKNEFEIKLLTPGIYNYKTDEYDKEFTGLKYNHAIFPKAKDAVMVALQKAVEANDQLKKDLINSKKSYQIKCDLYNHEIRIQNKSDFCNPYIQITSFSQK